MSNVEQRISNDEVNSFCFYLRPLLFSFDILRFALELLLGLRDFVLLFRLPRRSSLAVGGCFLQGGSMVAFFIQGGAGHVSPAGLLHHRPHGRDRANPFLGCEDMRRNQPLVERCA